MTKILITNPAHDDVTRYLFVWTRDIISLAENKSYNIKEFSHKDVKRENVESFIKKQNPDFIIFHGHGSPDTICGFNLEVIINDENYHHLKNKITYSITCSSASSLGESVIEGGGKAFIGFAKDFWLLYDPNFVSDPKKDPRAICNIEPLMQFSKSMLKNNTVKDAYKRSQDCFKKWLETCQRSDAPIELEGLADFIHWNMINQKVIGDGTAKLN